jgi:hypothetical protein
MPGRKRLIRKYANRKLYDVESSRYITLDGISRLVREGHDIQVVDRDSGRDLTSLVLSQIVTAEEKRTREDRAAGVGDGSAGAGALLDYVRRTLNVPAALVSGEVERRRGDLEDLVDLAIERALQGLSIPSRRDLERLERKLDQLAKRVDAVAAAGGPVRRTRRRTAGAGPST